MTCHACSAEMIGPDRFCRNCGAPVQRLVSDLIDTNRFPPADVKQGQRPTQPNLPPQRQWPSRRYSYRPSCDRVGGGRPGWVALIVLFILLSVGASTIVRVASAFRHRPRGGDAAAPFDPGYSGPRGETLVKNGLGIKPGRLSDSGITDLRGLFVDGLTSEGTPASIAGIQSGDVLVSIGNQDIASTSDVAKILAGAASGAEFPIKLVREGEPIVSKIKISDPQYTPVLPTIDNRDRGFFGIDDRNRRSIPGTKKWGVELGGVTSNEPADLAGLRNGDVITEIDGHPVATQYEMRRRIGLVAPRTRVLVKYFRDGLEQTTEITAGHH